MTLTTLPFSTFPLSSPQYPQYLATVFLEILTIPLLPNRLPLYDVLPRFISQLPLANLHVLKPHIASILANTTLESKVHLAANVYMFLSPHYKLLSPTSFETYLELSIGLFNALPPPLFEVKEGGKKGGKASKQHPTTSAWNRDGYNSDGSDGPSTRVSVVATFDVVPPPSIPKIDNKTLARLFNVISAQHLGILISTTQSKPSLFPHLINYLFALVTAWASSSGQILNIVLASTGGALVREIYRNLVRRSPLGQEENSGSIMDAANAPYYPPLLFLADLYSQALLTMGDDEFFGSTRGGFSGAGARVARNPLTLDELVSLSKQLLNIAFTLYWRDDGGPMGERYISMDVKVTWESVREKLTKCLLGIHAREYVVLLFSNVFPILTIIALHSSRKPFVPADHWLVTSQLDMNSFVDAAVLEEQSLSTTSQASNGSVHPLPRHRAPSKRQMASISPRLGILNNIPFAIPFAVRVSIFRHFVVNDMILQGSMSSSGGWGARYDPFFRGGMGGRRKTRVQVRRGMVAQDGFDKLGDADLKAPVEISFIDQFGQEE